MENIIITIYEGLGETSEEDEIIHNEIRQQIINKKEINILLIDNYLNLKNEPHEFIYSNIDKVLYLVINKIDNRCFDILDTWISNKNLIDKCLSGALSALTEGECTICFEIKTNDNAYVYCHNCNNDVCIKCFDKIKKRLRSNINLIYFKCPTCRFEGVFNKNDNPLLAN